MNSNWPWHNLVFKKTMVHALLVMSVAPMLMMFAGIEKWSALDSIWMACLNVVLLFLWVLYVCGYWLINSRQSMMTMLYLAFFISVSMLLKTIPLPLGMTLAFLVPMLAAVYIHPVWGVMIGLAAQGLSALLFGGIGPWTPMQMMLFAVFSGVLLWVPRNLRRNLIFQLVYLFVWGVLYGFVMSLYVWPVIAPEQLTSQWSGFFGLYVSTSLFWDFFRAVGNVFVWLLAWRALRAYFVKVYDLCVLLP